MRVPRTRRGERADGFTLVETIVTIGLIAVIAAFVIPTVVQKAESGHALRPQYGSNASADVSLVP
jgi:prepilin-type N-terminal cleavage/methylation domain-containing protein